MSGRVVLPMLRSQKHWRRVARTTAGASRSFALVEPAPPAPSTGTLPDSLKRMDQATSFPNEYPGQVYAFNWCLNGDGVTPLRKSAFRITKPLDLKVAKLEVPKKMGIKVKAAPASSMPEAGSDKLSFDQFDEVSQRTRDLLSLSDHLYCPEGHIPGTRTSVRIITNSATLAPQLLAYLERAPRKDPPDSLPVTAYVLESASGEESFAGYAIEEVEVPVPPEEPEEELGWVATEDSEEEFENMEAKSVAAVVVVAQKPDIATVVAGLELSQKALAADEVERQAKKDAEEKAKESA